MTIFDDTISDGLLISATETNINGYLFVIPPINNTISSTAEAYSGTFITGDTTINTTFETPVIYQFNLRNSEYIYKCTIKNSSYDDLVVPIESFQSRMRTGNQTYLSITIPTDEYYDEIYERKTGGYIVIELAYRKDGIIVQTEPIITVAIDTVTLYIGTKNKSILAYGYKTETYDGKVLTITDASYRSVINGKLRYRLCEPNIYLKPGDTVTIDGVTFVVNVISYFISTLSQTIEIAEE